MKVFGADSETRLSEPGIAAPRIVCGSVAGEAGCKLLTPSEWLAFLRRRLPTARIVGCNLVYDLACAAAMEPELLDLIFAALDAGTIHDVAIREALIDIARGELAEKSDDGIGQRYGMTLLVERYFGIDLKASKHGPDAWRLRYGELEGTPIGSWPYAAKVYPLLDAEYPRQIYFLQEGKPNLHDEANQVRAAFALQLMSVWGMRSDRATVADLRARVEEQDRKTIAEFQAHGVIRADGTENKKRLAELVTAAYGGDPPKTKPSKKFPAGQVSTDRDTLTESGDPALERYGRAGKNDKYLSTYLPILEQGIDAPWNPQFNILVATTRVSSNAQQFPQKGGVREGWIARPGTVICSVDYGGLELRTMSQRAIWDVGFSNMADALNGGKDVHVIAGASFMGVAYDEAFRRYKAGESVVQNFRDLGKTWNFSKGGGGGPGSMVYTARKGTKGETTKAPDGTVYVGVRFCILAGRAERCGVRKVPTKVQGKERRICAVCLDVAKQLDGGWLRAWPEQAALFKRANELSKSQRYLTARIPVSKVLRGKCGYTQWLNTPFQGLGAAATKRAMWLICREMYTDRSSVLWGSRMLLNVHDELLSELLEERAAQAGDRKAFIMRETLKEFVPDLAKAVEADPALSRTMAKEAKTVRDANGVLQVWVPKPKPPPCVSLS